MARRQTIRWTNRVQTPGKSRKLCKLVGEPIEKADTDFVRQRTGFSIGVVPPVGHAESLWTWIDEDLLAYEGTGAAAGTPHAVFELKPTDLLEMTGGEIAAITMRRRP